MLIEPTSFTQLLRQHSKSIPSTTALEFLPQGEEASLSFTYEQLDQAAGQLANHLRKQGLVGKTALLLFHSSTDYLVALFACFYAGVIAVPAYPPKNNHHARRLDNIVSDANVEVVLTHSSLVEKTQEQLNFSRCIGSDAVAPEPYWFNEDQGAQSVAYLQYTSGSTGNPKGVMVTHCNVMANCRIYGESMGLDESEVHVSWLPLFHDMGLVQGILLPLYLGATAVFMPPAKFVQRPQRWLNAMSRYKAVMTGGPNFAFQLCVSRTTQEDLEALDLSSWRVAVNGAEPVLKSTLDSFIEKFSPLGFSPSTFFPGYGMAETTLYVTSGNVNAQTPDVTWVQEEALKANRVLVCDQKDSNAKPVIACGTLNDEVCVEIVNPQTGRPSAADEVGEIWVSGVIVCAGYWRKKQETERDFGAVLENHPDKTFFKTGDLGFIHEGQLHITGRIKDVIIVRGENHYPHDIEYTVEQVNSAFRRGGFCAAFTVSEDDMEKLVVIQEIERTQRNNIDISVLRREVARSIFEVHGITLDDVVFVLPGEVLKTSSGKVQRSGCKEKYLHGKFRLASPSQQVANNIDECETA